MKIKHVKGNVLRLEIPLTIKRKELVDGEVVENVEDFYPCSDYPTYINFKKSLTIPFEASVQGNLARMQDNGTLNVGTYQIEVMCCDEAGNPYRYMVRDIVEVVDATADADIEEGVEFNAETYTLEGAVFISYGVEQVQADWTETDIHSKAYINNKPTNLVEDERYVHTDNNYTDEEKEKLADLENYDDSGIRQELDGKVDKITGKGLSTNDYTTSEKTKLGALPTNEELTQALGGKANTSDLAEVATSGSYNDLSDKPTIPTVPTNVSAFTNDAGYLTQHQDITEKADKVSSATNGNFAALDNNGNLIDSGHKHSDYLTSHQDLSNYVQKSNTQGLLKNDGTVDTNTYLTQHQDISGKADKSEMSVVPGTGANADKTTITLKQGTSATVLTAHQDITGKENVMPITMATGATLSAVVGNYYRLDNVDTLAITLPTITGATKIQAITFLLVCGSSALVTFAPQGSETILYQEGFALEADTTYEVTALWNGSEWTLSRVIYE